MPLQLARRADPKYIALIAIQKVPARLGRLVETSIHRKGVHHVNKLNKKKHRATLVETCEGGEGRNGGEQREETNRGGPRHGAYSWCHKIDD